MLKTHNLIFHGRAAILPIYIGRFQISSLEIDREN